MEDKEPDFTKFNGPSHNILTLLAFGPAHRRYLFEACGTHPSANTRLRRSVYFVIRALLKWNKITIVDSLYVMTASGQKLLHDIGPLIAQAPARAPDSSVAA